MSSENQDQERALTNVSETYLASCPYRGSCNGFSQQFYDEAHSHGMGCGRYAAAVRLSELDPNISVDDCSGMTMRELHDRIAIASRPPGKVRVLPTIRHPGRATEADQETARDRTADREAARARLRDRATGKARDTGTTEATGAPRLGLGPDTRPIRRPLPLLRPLPVL